MKRGLFSQEQVVVILHPTEKGETAILAFYREYGIRVSPSC